MVAHHYGMFAFNTMPEERIAFASAIFLFALFITIVAGDLFLQFALEDKGFFEMATKSHALSVFEDQDQSLPQPGR